MENKSDKKIGVCIHLVEGFICSCGKYQNYPCPHRGNTAKGSCCVPFTEQMEKQWKEKGYFSF